MKLASTIALLMLSTGASALDVNWRSLDKDTRYLGGIQFGADYGSYYSFSYGQKLNNGNTPVIAGYELLLPFGDTIADDYKMKASLQREFWSSGNLSFSLQGGLIFRRYESVMARFYNVGADVVSTFGYLKPNWGAELLVGYDYSMATHIKNKLLKEYYPEIKDGWYDSSGGNFKFGARFNRVFGSTTTFFNIGKAFGQDFEDNPTLPFYVELSLQRQF